jgi:CxxC motif-containing protein (DUF1111 family)
MTTPTIRLPNKRLLYIALLIGTAILGIGLSNLIHLSSSPSIPLAAGDLTNFTRSSTGFEQIPDVLTGDDLTKHRAGDNSFDAVFVTPPARINSGLGPVFNNASCGACHIKDGRGLPEKGQLLIRVSDPTNEQIKESVVQLSKYHKEAVIDIENTPPVAGLGNQIQDQAIYGAEPEGTVEIDWKEQSGQYLDGTKYQLRSPIVSITYPDGKPLDTKIQTSPRLPQPVFGLGLLEVVPERTIRNLADPEDKNQDGISGKVNEVWDGEKKAVVLGRFGWKAGNPTIKQQSAAAYVNDMGVTNLLFPEADKTMDIDATTLEETTFYVQTLGAPVRGLLDDTRVVKGEKLFSDANCSACHIAELKTGESKITVLANQTIHPYTDLLLHDMGAGLADNRPDFRATGTEWRTPPLWGLGLTKTVLAEATYLHDGRARTVEEAILWHDGEAKVSKEKFLQMSKEDRSSLVRFLNSL